MSTIYLGVEWGGKFSLVGPGGITAVFNDDTDPNFVGVLSPESSGIDSAEVREDAAEKVEADGAIFGDFFAGKRPVILQGTIIASSAAQRNERIGKLLQASNALREDAYLLWEPEGSGVEVKLTLRRQQRVNITKGYVKEFQVPMVAAEPRILRNGARSDSATGMAISNKTLVPSNGFYAEEIEGVVGGAKWITQGKWTGLTSMAASDNVYAVGTAETNEASTETGLEALIAKSWAEKSGGTALEGVPSGVWFSGLKLEVERKASEASRFHDEYVLLGSEVGGKSVFNSTNKSAGAAWPTSDTVATFGSATDLWGFGKTFPKSSIQNFLTAIRPSETATGTPSGKTASVDQQKLTVYYYTPLAVQIENEGNANAIFTIKVTGPIFAPTLENPATGEKVSYESIIGTGQYIIFDFNNKTLVNQSGSDVYAYLDFEETSQNWIEAPPGITEIMLTGLTSTSATAMLVEWLDAWE